MPEAHRPGTPCWVVLVTPDTERTGSFYAGLFGWSQPKADAGFQTVECDGSEVAGVLQLPPEAAAGSQPPAWARAEAAACSRAGPLLPAAVLRSAREALPAWPRPLPRAPAPLR